MNPDRDSRKFLLPLLGVLASSVFLSLAAARYPGGYDWLNQTVSSLFQPLSLAGEINSARPLAVLAVLVFCVSIAWVFHHISKRGRSRFHQSTIQIGGIGSMVYAFLTVTPMHDVLVGVALLFFVTAMAAVFHMLFLERSFWMLGAGIVCIAGTLWNATMYYVGVLSGFLPAVQKLSLVLWVGWLFLLYFTEIRKSKAGQA